MDVQRAAIAMKRRAESVDSATRGRTRVYTPSAAACHSSGHVSPSASSEFCTASIAAKRPPPATCLKTAAQRDTMAGISSSPRSTLTLTSVAPPKSGSPVVD